MTTLSCKVTSVEAITDTVYRVRIVPDAAFSFRAGQYLMVVMDERDKRPFSMASTPDEKGFIELHIGASEINLTRKQSWTASSKIIKSWSTFPTEKRGCAMMKSVR